MANKILIIGVLISLISSCGNKENRIEVVDVYDVILDSISVDDLYCTMTDTSVTFHPDIQYRKQGQGKRKWNREIYYSDMDSIVVARWHSLTNREILNAIRRAFSFDFDDSEWDKYSDSENVRRLLENAIVEWK